MGRDEIIRWSEIIGDSRPSQELLEGMNPTEKGRAIHSWLESNYEQEFDDCYWENEIFWYEGDSLEMGKYDAFDGNFIYEFKTKYDHSMRDDLLPIEDDMEQVRDYLDATIADYGVLIYIGRDNWEMKEYLISPGVEKLGE